MRFCGIRDLWNITITMKEFVSFQNIKRINNKGFGFFMIHNTK